MKLRSPFLTFTFAFVTFERWAQNFGVFQTDSKFQSFALLVGKSYKSQYHSYLHFRSQNAQWSKSGWKGTKIRTLAQNAIRYHWIMLNLFQKQKQFFLEVTRTQKRQKRGKKTDRKQTLGYFSLDFAVTTGGVFRPSVS